MMTYEQLLASKNNRLAFLSKAKEACFSYPLAHVKRFLEAFMADAGLRQSLYQGDDVTELLATYRINLDLEQVRPLWDNAVLLPGYDDGNNQDSDLWKAYLSYDAKLQSSNAVQQEKIVGGNKHYLTWLNRQKSRCALELGNESDFIVHAPLAIELTDGCSVGCWFCGVSADKFKGNFKASVQNLSLFKEVVAKCRDYFSDALRTSSLYFSTDPFDNPDYEVFAEHYQHITGFTPNTTTALAVKDLERTEKLIYAISADNNEKVRFSILTLNSLKKLFQHFSPEQTFFCKIVPMLKGSVLIKAKAGKALVNAKQFEKDNENKAFLTLRRGAWRRHQTPPSTISCISGLVINMPQRRLKLITSCRASDMYPNGYKILYQADFLNGKDLGYILTEKINQYLAASNQLNNHRISFNNELKFTDLSKGFALQSPSGKKISITNNRHSAMFQCLGRLIKEGAIGLEKIILLANQFNVPEEQITKVMEYIFQQGVIEEDTLAIMYN